MAIGLLAVSARSPDFLYIILKALWHLHMNHALDIIFINSHSKSSTGYYNPDLVIHKVLLQLFPEFLGHSGVIESRIDTTII